MTNDAKNLLNNSTQPAILSDLKAGKILYANDATFKYLDIQQEALIGSKITELFQSMQSLQECTIWKRGQKQYQIQEEEISISGHLYNKATLKIVDNELSDSLVKTIQHMVSLLLHRLRSPLTGVLGFNELLHETGPNVNQRYLESIDHGLKDINAILNEIESLTEIPDIHIQTVDLNQFISRIVRNFRNNSKANIQVELSNVPHTFKTDPAILEDCINELLSNAVDHSNSELEPITIQVKPNGNICITNYGPVIPMDQTQEIFYPFVTTKIRNMGLGLTKSSIRAHAMNAHIRLVTNSPIEGISFEIQFSTDYI